MTLRRSAGLIALLLLALAGLFLRGEKDAIRTNAGPPTPPGQTEFPPAPPPAPTVPQAQAPLPLPGSKIHLPGPGDPGTASPSTGQATAPTPPKPAPAPKSAPPAAATGEYILALSWSPSFCADEDPGGRSDQRRIGVGKGLVVHGLWPDEPNRRDEYCPTSEPSRLPDDIARRIKGIMPSVSLARHEWEKHGACTGLGQRGYFETMEHAWRQFRVPPLLADLEDRKTISAADLAATIAKANPDLNARSIVFACGSAGVLSEIRLCLTGDLKARDCGRASPRDCSGSITLLPPR